MLKPKVRIWFYGILSFLNLIVFNISAKFLNREACLFHLAILLFTGLLLWLEVKQYKVDKQ